MSSWLLRRFLSCTLFLLCRLDDCRRWLVQWTHSILPCGFHMCLIQRLQTIFFSALRMTSGVYRSYDTLTTLYVSLLCCLEDLRSFGSNHFSRYCFDDCGISRFNVLRRSFFCIMPTNSDDFAFSRCERLQTFLLLHTPNDFRIIFSCTVSNNLEFLPLSSCPRRRTSGFFALNVVNGLSQDLFGVLLNSRYL